MTTTTPGSRPHGAAPASGLDGGVKMWAQPSAERRDRLVRLWNRSRRLAATNQASCRSRGTAEAPALREARLTAGLEMGVVDARHAIRIELFGDLGRASTHRLSECLERSLETRAERLVLDLSGLDRLDAEAVSPILVAQLIADSEHRQLLLIPGSRAVQRVLDRVHGPFSYLDPDDESLRHHGVLSRVSDTRHEQARPRRRILHVLLGLTDRLIAATEHASEPISTLEYVGASALLGALELFSSIEPRRDRS